MPEFSSRTSVPVPTSSSLRWSSSPQELSRALEEFRPSASSGAAERLENAAFEAGEEIRREFEEEVQRAIDRLSPKLRTIVVLRYLENFRTWTDSGGTWRP